MKQKHISSLSYKRDRKALEKRRIQAIGLYRKGKTQYQIAKQLEVSFEAVSNWVELYKKRGFNGLKSAGKPGPKPKLTQENKQKVRTAILNGPRAAGYSTDIWTLSRISALIRKLTKKTFKTTQTWRIVVSLGFTCQKPATKNKERDEAAIKNWKENEFPSLKKMGSQT